ncbi:MAG: hypothetical protein ABIE07_03540 [Candidatus Zixiibacteriota bacterium]
MGLEYLRSARQIANDGLHVFLNGYQYHAFLNFVEIYDVNGVWGKLNERLGGRGVRNLEEELKFMQLEPVLNPLRAVLSQKTIDSIKGGAKEGMSIIKKDISKLYDAIMAYMNWVTMDESIMSASIMNIEKLSLLCSDKRLADSIIGREHILLGAIIIDSFKKLQAGKSEIRQREFINDLFNDWMLRPALRSCFESIAGDESTAYADVLLTEVLVKFPELVSDLYEKEEIKFGGDFIDTGFVKEYLQVNEYEGNWYFNKEYFEKLIETLLSLTIIKNPQKSLSKKKYSALCKVALNSKKMAEKLSYRLDKFVILK